MTELKVTSKKYNDKDVLEVENFNAEVKPIVDQAIQADKDIISQIKMTYNEESDITDIKFPKGVIPLSITFNTSNNKLFIKNNVFVDARGEEVEGYELDDYSFDRGKVNMQVLGNISEQDIKSLTYISFNGDYGEIISNTYNLFFPQSGTKLYKHHLEDSDLGYVFILITHSSTPINFSTYDTFKKIYDLIKEDIVDFYLVSNLAKVLYDESVEHQYFYCILNDSGYNTLVMDDWNLSETTDTVTEL